MKTLALNPNETVNLLIRKHWLIIAAESFILFLIVLLPIILTLTVDAYINIEITKKAFVLALVFYLTWLLFIWIIFFLAWTDYYLDVWVVTNERLIDIEQKGVFNREISSLRLDRIQDITVEVKGILPTLLSFGDIHVQTAGQNREIIIKNIARPYQAKEMIGRLHDQSIIKLKTSGMSMV